MPEAHVIARHDVLHRLDNGNPVPMKLVDEFFDSFRVSRACWAPSVVQSSTPISPKIRARDNTHGQYYLSSQAGIVIFSRPLIYWIMISVESIRTEVISQTFHLRRPTYDNLEQQNPSMRSPQEPSADYDISHLRSASNSNIRSNNPSIAAFC